MATTRVKVEGLRELEKALMELPKNIGKGVLRRVLIKAGTPMQKAAQAKAPTRDDPRRKITFGPKGQTKVRRVGTTKALVQIGTRLTKNQARQAKKQGKDSMEAYVGTRDRAARLVEFGTREARAEPFMRPAWDGNKHGMLDTISQELGSEIAKAAARVAKKKAKAAAGG